MATRQAIDPAWWDTEQSDGVPMRQVLAERDIKALLQFLRRRGWSWGAIAQATDIGEQRVREIANGKRRIENYDVYVRVAVGLNIPRDYIGVGLRPIDEPTVAVGSVVGRGTHDVPGEMTVTLKNAIERATPAEVADHGKPDLDRFESQVSQAWADRRHTGQRETNLILVAGLAGSGKTEFAKFLSAVTGWALLDKDVLTRPMVESMLVALKSDPNDRHSELYRAEVRPVEYRSLLNATFANIDNGISTVVTAPFLAEVSDLHWLRWLLHRCDTAGAHPEIVWVSADVETMHTYLQMRDAARDAWKLNHWQEYLASINLDLRPALPHFFIDNSLGSAVRLADEARRISEWIGK
ncbi:AAA family ATPase [Micromonospora globispora]|nr:AAA family ATPase [Micromonospora globispora]